MSKVLYTRVPDDVHAALVKIARANDRPVAVTAGQLVEIGVAVLQERGEIELETNRRRLVVAPAKGRRR